MTLSIALPLVTLKFAVSCCSAMLMCRQWTMSNYPRTSCYYCIYDAGSHLFELILMLFFIRTIPLHLSASRFHLEISRLLIESKADVAARNRCFGPPPSHHLSESLTVCLAALATQHANALNTVSCDNVICFVNKVEKTETEVKKADVVE
jgi:hypothetical protein